ncbi:hypothetical protein C8R44DRAFT_890843 [Mycena epipterygia]|nr:hypothetical protein C8R44DRAFT_890843 [Mycena epipterygia]
MFRSLSLRPPVQQAPTSPCAPLQPTPSPSLAHPSAPQASPARINPVKDKARQGSLFVTALS